MRIDYGSEGIVPKHLMYWPITEIPDGMYTNGCGLDITMWLMDVRELGERVVSALDDEAMGMGPLFNLQYELYLREEGALS